jgi:hypothetical protein
MNYEALTLTALVEMALLAILRLRQCHGLVRTRISPSRTERQQGHGFDWNPAMMLPGTLSRQNELAAATPD